MNTLVELFGNGSNEMVVTSSTSVAKYFKKRHEHVVDAIHKLLQKDNPKIRAMFFDHIEKTAYNKDRKVYLMNRDGFCLVVMGFTGDEALEWKLDYIEHFNQMEDMLKRIREERTNTIIEREKGKVVRNALTDVIKKMITDSPHKKFAYANYTKLIYKICFGMTMDELRAKYGATTKESVRDLMSADDLAEVSHKEFLVCGLINEGWGYKEIRNFMEANCRPAIEPSLKLDTSN